MKIDWFTCICMSMALLSFCVILVLCKAAQKKEKRIRLLAIILAVVFSIAFMGSEPAKAAEVEYFSVEEITDVEVLVFNWQLTTRVSFNYHGETLSWYEDGLVAPWVHYVVKVWNDMEVVNSALL